MTRQRERMLIILGMIVGALSTWLGLVFGHLASSSDFLKQQPTREEVRSK